MVHNYNGELLEAEDFSVSSQNRSFRYGDGLFETMKYSRGKLHFWEDHYFRLMSSARILRMEIPMNFSPEYFLEQVNELVKANHWEKRALRLRLTVWRADGGLYVPENNNIQWLLEGVEMEEDLYPINEKGLQIELYKEHYKAKGLLQNIKSTSSQFYNVAGVYLKENGWEEAVIINDDKHVVETLYGNLFMVKGDKILTPALSTGCIKGIMRKQVIDIAQRMQKELEETTFSPFELQRADEVFITNAVKGIQWVSGYRKKTYEKKVSAELADKLNLFVTLG
ncbi:MAG: aminotransferase class IV [Schleiferiaceae bacterium]